MEPSARRLQKAALAEEIHRNRLAVRRMQRATRAAARAEERDWRLSGCLRNTVVIIYEMAGYKTDPAVRFLQSIGRQRHWSTQPDAALHWLAEKTFLGLMGSVGAAAVAALVNTTSPSDAVAMHTARRWAEEWGLFTWAERQNVERGVTPSTAALLIELARMRAAVGRAPPGTTAQSKVRQWGTSFRRRWGGHFGSIPAKDHVPLDEMQRKAATYLRWGWLLSCMCHHTLTRGSTTGRISMSENGSDFTTTNRKVRLSRCVSSYYFLE
jgi:hypothetical protein